MPNEDHLRMFTNNRVGWKGGGIVLIYKKEYSFKIIKNSTKSSFQYSIWSMNARNKHLTIIRLYHPSYSPLNPTNNIFIDKITELLTEILPSSKNYIILGDFYLHVSIQDDVDTHIFSDSMETLGLKEHSMIPTHKSNTVFDLTFTKIISDLSVEAVETASYISDCCPVIATPNIMKEQVKWVQGVTCKATKIRPDKWHQECNELNVKWDNKPCWSIVQWTSQSVWCTCPTKTSFLTS